MEAGGRLSFPAFTKAIRDMDGEIWTLSFHQALSYQGQGLYVIPLWDLGLSLGSGNLY